MDAVVCEPVSAAKFPANRQKTGNFRRKRPDWAVQIAVINVISMSYDEIPYSVEQGIFLQEQGILSGEQGIFASLWDFAVRRQFFRS